MELKTNVKEKLAEAIELWANDKYFDEWSKDVRNIGQLSKGKIHCSCYMRRRKSYDELAIYEKRKLLALEQRLKDNNLLEEVNI
jgi:hypothetical protein